jgi:hypothetical protein
MTAILTTDEWIEISHQLEQHHAIFYKLWQMGKPVFTDSIETAAVQFDQDGSWIDFLFNPEFWNSLSLYEKTFVISHECLHVILNHGIRTIDSENRDKANKALDIVVNHMLVRCFGFDRSKITTADDLCWVDTIFKNHPQKDSIPDNESFEFYVQLIPDNPCLVLDDHSFMGRNWDDVIEKVGEGLSPEQREAMKGFLNQHGCPKAGTGEGYWTTLDISEVPKKRKWETIIKKWSKKYLKDDCEDKEQWARIGRRYSLLPNELFLPTEVEDDHFKKDRLPVFFFLDTSGSCYGFKERFFKAALSLPKEKFDIRLFCFDTKVQETSLESRKIYGGGGTAFNIIENHIQQIMNSENITYPEAVFLITDGFGSSVTPKHPDRWYWFLTPYNSKFYIPQSSKIFELKDFE